MLIRDELLALPEGKKTWLAGVFDGCGFVSAIVPIEGGPPKPLLIFRSRSYATLEVIVRMLKSHAPYSVHGTPLHHLEFTDIADALILKEILYTYTFIKQNHLDAMEAMLKAPLDGSDKGILTARTIAFKLQEFARSEYGINAG